MRTTPLQPDHGFSNIDFDHWSEIARISPEIFETMRTKIIRNCIHNAPQNQQKRMLGLQWQIDCLRLQSRNPLSACLKISHMMWETLQKLSDASQDLAGPEQPVNSNKVSECVILPLAPLKNSTK